MNATISQRIPTPTLRPESGNAVADRSSDPERADSAELGREPVTGTPSFATLLAAATGKENRTAPIHQPFSNVDVQAMMLDTIKRQRELETERMLDRLLAQQQQCVSLALDFIR